MNAKDVYDIDRFDQHDTRRIQITPEDNRKYYKHFDHIMSHQWQEEVLVVYDMVTALCDGLESKRAARITKNAKSTEREFFSGGVGLQTKTHPVVHCIHGTATEFPDCLMQGYLLKLGGVFNSSWQQRYLHLFADRIEWRNDQLVRMSKRNCITKPRSSNPPLSSSNHPSTRSRLRKSLLWRRLCTRASRSFGWSPTRSRTTFAPRPTRTTSVGSSSSRLGWQLQRHLTRDLPSSPFLCFDPYPLSTQDAWAKARNVEPKARSESSDAASSGTAAVAPTDFEPADEDEARKKQDQFGDEDD